MMLVEIGEPHRGRQVGRDRGRRMLHEVRPDPLERRDHGDPVPLQVCARPDAAPHQQRRRVDRARRDDHLVRPDGLRRAARRRAAPTAPIARPPSITSRSAIRPVSTVSWPPPHLRRQIGQRRRHPLAARRWSRSRRHRYRRPTPRSGPASAHVPAPRRASHHRPHIGRHPLRRNPPDRDRPVPAMERPGKIGVALELPEIGQGRFPRPSLGAHRAPLVVVARRAPVGDHGVDRRSAAEKPRLLVAPRRPPFGPAERRAEKRLEVGPDVLRDRGTRGPDSGSAHAGAIVSSVRSRAGLDQGHAERRVFAQPRRQRTARGTASQDQKMHRTAPG